MTGMLEKAARAYQERLCRFHAEQGWPSIELRWGELSETGKAAVIEAQRAALQALMEPGEDVMRALWTEMDEQGIDIQPYHLCEEALLAAWQAALKRILESSE